MTPETIRAFLERYGQAISAGDLTAISQCWAVPALVLSDAGAIPVSEAAEVERFFAAAVKAYHDQGFMSTRPEVQHIERLSDGLVAVDVRWPSFDAAGTEKASERSYYILAAGADGQPHIRVTLPRSA